MKKFTEFINEQLNGDIEYLKDKHKDLYRRTLKFYAKYSENLKENPELNVEAFFIYAIQQKTFNFFDLYNKLAKIKFELKPNAEVQKFLNNYSVKLYCDDYMFNSEVGFAIEDKKSNLRRTDIRYNYYNKFDLTREYDKPSGFSIQYYEKFAQLEGKTIIKTGLSFDKLKEIINKIEKF